MRTLVITPLLVAAHLAAVPLISFYGLRVCPILENFGFLSGCYYVGAFVTTSLLTNFALIGPKFFRARRASRDADSSWLLRLPFDSFISYGLATLIALGVLVALLKPRGLSGLSRAPEILAFLGFLLGLLQYYAVTWMIQPMLSRGRRVDAERAAPTNWARAALAGFLPVLTVMLFFLHYLFSQSASWNHGSIPTPRSPDQFIRETSILLAFLLAWLTVVQLLYFATESDQSKRVRSHLEHIAEMDTAYRSSTFATGYWREILSALNQTSQLMVEKSRLVGNFAKFVSESVARNAVEGDIEAGGTRSELTIFMTDLRGFTAMSRTLRPEQVVKLLNVYFSAMIEELGRHGVVLDKFIGDGILAYVPPSEQSAEKDNDLAVRASAGMLQRLAGVNRELTEEGLPKLEMGIGICRGSVVLGNIGSKTRLQYTVIGTPVNRAARLESLCKKLGSPLIVDDDVFATLSPERKKPFRDLGAHALPGFSDAIQVFGL